MDESGQPALAPVRRPQGWGALLHAALIPAVPSLALWAGNASEVATLLPLRIALVSAAIGLLLTAIVTIVQRDLRRSALIASGLVFGGSTHGLIFGPEATLGLFAALAGATLLVWISVRMRESSLRALTTVLNVTALALIVTNSAIVAQQRPTAPDVAPDPVAVGETRSDRDVWFISPDRYPDLQVLEDHGVDTRGFGTALEARGFTVIDGARANYLATQLSLASAWNAQLLEIPEDAAPVAHAVDLLRDPLIGRAFREAGYSYHHVGTWFDATASSASATVVHTLQAGQEFYNAYESNTIIPSIRRFLPVSMYYLDPITDRQEHHARHQFSVLRHLASRAPKQPEFVLAHITLPHGPYIFRADGSIRDRLPRRSETRTAYEEQLAFLNSQLLDVVDRLLNRDAPPVIVLLADEGLYPHTLSSSQPDDHDLGALTPEQMQDKLSIIAAVYDPDPDTDAGRPIDAPRTSVNVVRRLLNRVLDMGLPLIEERSYRWEPTDEGGTMVPIDTSAFEGAVPDRG